MARGPMEYDVKGMTGLQDTLDAMGCLGKEAGIEGVHDWLEYTFEVAQRVVPTDGGLLASTGKVDLTQTGGSITYDAPYAAAVHDGYVRHWVGPKHRKALRWEVDRVGRLEAGGKVSNAKFAYSKGHYVPARRARSTPNPWLANSVDQTLQFVGQFIIEQYEARVFEGRAA